MADFFFFTDIDLLLSQTSDEAFGSILPADSDYDANKEKYRLTSIHKAASNPLAYAICKGQILVQEDSTNSTLVNIILKPEVQPKNDLPVIKYYIYRGILKNSLTDGTNVINGNNTLTKHILGNNTSTSQKVLGIELTGTNYSGTDNIDNAFYLPKVGFELWTVYGGWSIGTFDKNGFGLDIVFERLGYNPDFNIARSNKNIFEIQKLTGAPSQADEFEYKTKKEVVLNYIDPCAFYGNFYSDAINARSSTDSIDSNSLPSFNKKKGDEIYREIIEGGTSSSPLNNYYNKNVVYLDIRNDLNFSFNYFENYDNNLKISFVDDNNEPVNLLDYYNSGWPILKLDSMPTGNNTSSVKIAFPLNADMPPLACLLTGKRKVSLLEKIKYGKTRFVNLTIDLASSNYSTNSLFIESSNYNNNVPVSQYLRVKYLNRVVKNLNSSTGDINLLNKVDGWDLVFDMKSFSIHSQLLSNNVNLYTFNENAYIDSSFDNSIDFIADIGYTQDSTNILFFAFGTLVNKNSFTRVANRNFSFTNKHIIQNLFEELKSQKNNINLESKLFEFSSSSIEAVRLKTQTNNSFFTDSDPNKTLLVLNISKTDWNSIILNANTTFANFSPIYFVFKNRNDNDNDLTNDVDLKDEEYLTSDVYLRGIVNNSGVLTKHDLQTNIKVYSYPNN